MTITLSDWREWTLMIKDSFTQFTNLEPGFLLCVSVCSEVCKVTRSLGETYMGIDVGWYLRRDGVAGDATNIIKKKCVQEKRQRVHARSWKCTPLHPIPVFPVKICQHAAQKNEYYISTLFRNWHATAVYTFRMTAFHVIIWAWWKVGGYHSWLALQW